MSSGACRALVAILLTLVALAGSALPVAAKSDALTEQSRVIYTVKPARGEIDVQMRFNLRTRGQAAFPPQEWGPIVVEEETTPSATNPFRVLPGGSSLPGLWREINVETPRIEGGAGREQFIVRYTIDASVDKDDARRAQTPARVDESYMYFCVPGQDTDNGSVEIRIEGNASSWRLTQNGTPLEATDTGLRSTTETRRLPAEIFTCIEGVRESRLVTDSFIGPADREIVLQAWAGFSNWLQAAESRSEPALDAIHRFLGLDIPGDGPVIIRQSPLRELGGYASAHNTPGVVQLDENAGVVAPEHELAHAWFGTNNFRELWLREGLSLWTASAMAGGSDDAACPAAGSNELGLDLGEDSWQVVAPRSGSDIEQIVEAQDAAACGIVSAIAARLTPQQWREVLRSMLEGETKYIGPAGPEVAANPAVDYREFLDAVDERGLVPAGFSDLDFAQDLLDAYGIPESAPKLAQRSEARALYHQFLADAVPLAAPAAVRKALDDWEFEEAIAALRQSYVVLDAIKEADQALPTAGLIPLIQRPFEEASSVEEIDAVRTEAIDLLERATDLVSPLGELQSVTPSGWEFPAAIRSAINERRFDDAMTAIAPAIAVVQEITAADAALPAAGILEFFRARYEATTAAAALDDLAADVINVRRAAERTGRALALLESEVGDWRIPAAVNDPIENGQIVAGLAVVEDARAVVAAATAGDTALPEAQMRAGLRERFEAVQTGAEMAALRAEAEARRDEAVAVGEARSALRTLVPDWRIPDIVTEPIEEGDFASAAVTAAAARAWVENAARADADWPEFGALDRIKADFEAAGSLEQLVAGSELALEWSEAAAPVGRAIRAVDERPRDLLTEFGLWGIDYEAPLEEAKEAALAGDVSTAINKSAEVQSLISSGSSDGALRLTGLIFFGVAILGVMGLWMVLRRQRGPSWARQSTPHWIEQKRSLPWRRGGKAK